MNEQTDAVPQRMPKEFSVPGFGNFFPGNRIDFPAGHPGFDPIQRRLLRRPDNFIDLSLFFTCMTDRHRAGHIAAIIVKSRAEIHGYKIPFPDFPVGRSNRRPFLRIARSRFWKIRLFRLNRAFIFRENSGFGLRI